MGKIKKTHKDGFLIPLRRPIRQSQIQGIYNGRSARVESNANRDYSHLLSQETLPTPMEIDTDLSLQSPFREKKVTEYFKGYSMKLSGTTLGIETPLLKSRRKIRENFLKDMSRYVIPELVSSLFPETSSDRFKSKEFVKHGLNHFNEGRFAEAITCFDRAIESDPEYHKAYFWKGETHCKLNHLDEALKNLDCAVSKKWNWQYFLARGKVHYLKESLFLAEIDLGAARIFADNNALLEEIAEMEFVLGHVKAKLGKQSEADELFQSAKNYLPQQAESSSMDTQQTSVKPPEDNNDYFKGFGVKSCGTTLGIKTPNLKKHSQEDPESPSSLTDTTTDNRTRSKGCVELGITYLDRGMREIAKYYFTRATEADPTNDKAYFWKGEACFKLKELNDAFTCYKTAATKKPRWQYFAGMAKVNREAKNYPEAEVNLEKALNLANGKELLSEIAGIQFALGIIKFKLEKFSEAYNLFQAAETYSPEDKQGIVRENRELAFVKSLCEE